jgi:hypothetical protein
MNISELVGKKLPEIKKLLFSETTEEAFVDAKLVDGTIVRVEPALEIGASVAVIGEDGETVPAPDGEHELESGEVVRTEGGVIVEIMTPEPVAEEAEEVEEEMAAKKSSMLKASKLTSFLLYLNLSSRKSLRLNSPRPRRLRTSRKRLV